MVVIENPGKELDEITVVISGEKQKISSKSDPEVLYLVIEELSRVILNTQKRSFKENLNTLYKLSKEISGREVPAAISQIELVLAQLKAKKE
jgi:hypothetical protein